jgi:hypothetical protein
MNLPRTRRSGDKGLGCAEADFPNCLTHVPPQIPLGCGSSGLRCLRNRLWSIKDLTTQKPKGQVQVSHCETLSRHLHWAGRPGLRESSCCWVRTVTLRQRTAQLQHSLAQIEFTVKLRLDLLLSSAFVSFCPKIDQDSCLGAAL